MQFRSFAFVALVALLSDARPAKKPCAVGAAYSITNVEKNAVLVHAIAKSGKVSFSSGVPTGGSGILGVGGGPDALFGQGSVTVSGNNLYVVNSNSNDFTAFSINPNDPTKIKKMATIKSGGEFPTSIAVSQSLKMLCVMNGGKVNGVQCFTLGANGMPSKMAGGFRSLGLNQTTPANGPFDTASHIAFTDDSSQLLVSVKGNVATKTPGFVTSFAMKGGAMAQNGVKTPAPAGDILPFGMVAIPGTAKMMVSDVGTGASIYDFTKGAPAATTSINITGQTTTCWAAHSKKTGTFFLTDIGTANVFEVSANNQNQGTNVAATPLGNGTAPIDLAVGSTGGNDFLYVMQPNATSISVMALAAGGKSKLIQTFDFSKAAQAAGVSVTPVNLQGMNIFMMK